MSSPTCCNRIAVPVAVLILLLLLCFFPVSVALCTDPADTLHLEEILVLGTRIEMPHFRYPIVIQSVEPFMFTMLGHETAAYLISANTSAMIRDYGEGNMSLVSQRGFSAGQSRILWEDMPLNHPMLGVFDLSLIPAGMLDGISLTSGNPAAMSGSGGIGGTVNLYTKDHSDRAFLSQTIGSYGFEQTGTGATFQEGSISGSIRAFMKKADYDFEYKDPDPVRQLIRIRENNRKTGSFISAMGSYKLESWRFRSLLWLDNITNELPGSIYARSPALQEDRSFRLITRAHYDGFERTWLTSSAGWYRYVLDYTDKRTNRKTSSTANLHLIQSEARRVWSAGNESYFAFESMMQTIDSEHYGNEIRHNQFSIRVNHLWEALPNLKWHPSVEYEYHTEYGSSFHPATGITYEPTGDNLTLRGMIARNRKNPSFNDLYWQPGGNPDLLPEMVNTFEGGFTLYVDKRNTRKARRASYSGIETNASSQIRTHANPIVSHISPFVTHASAHVTVFRHDMENGIRWMPGSEGRFTAVNIDKFRSQGLEIEIKSGISSGRSQTDFSYIMIYTDAAIRRERFAGDTSVGKQMFYVPQWVHKAWLRSGYRESVWIMATIQKTAERYTTIDHSSPLDPLDSFLRIDLDTGFTFGIAKTKLELSSGIRNITNQVYQVISGYPVAPRHYSLSIRVSLI